MFSEGHTMKEIDNICYWDTCDYAEYVINSKPKSPGEIRMKELKPSQQRMIEERKKQEEKERRMKK